MQVNAFGIQKEELAGICCELGISEIHAGPWLRSFYIPSALAQIPQRLLSYQSQYLRFDLPVIKQIQTSSYDRSIKFLLEVEEGAFVEAVVMPESKRITICLSTQIGCAQGCTFCNTARMGLKRNLTAAEIVAQVVIAKRWIEQNPDWLRGCGLGEYANISNIVFMGMGEPLDNYDNLAKALRIFADQYAFSFAWKRMSVSTSGHLDGMKRLFDEFPLVRLALSLHTPYDQERSRIMPINKRYPLAEIMQELRSRGASIKDIMVQYTLIKDRNDSMEHADELVRILEGISAKINVIPFNPFKESMFRSPEAESLRIFCARLQELGRRVLVRYSKGQDIAAACGQLVTAKRDGQILQKMQ